MLFQFVASNPKYRKRNPFNKEEKKDSLHELSFQGRNII